MAEAVSIEPGRRLEYRPIIIASGTSLSGAIPCRGMALKGVLMPAAWSAANLTFQAAEKEAGTYEDLYDSAGTEVTVVAGASRAIGIKGIEREALASVNYLKVRSGTTGVPVVQAADRTLILVLGVSVE